MQGRIWRLRTAEDLKVASLLPSPSRHGLGNRLTSALAPSDQHESQLEARITGWSLYLERGRQIPSQEPSKGMGGWERDLSLSLLMIDLKSDSKNDHWYDWCQDHENTHVYLKCWSKIPQDNLTKWSQKQHRKKIKDWITKIPKELFLSLLISKGNKNCLAKHRNEI